MEVLTAEQELEKQVATLESRVATLNSVIDVHWVQRAEFIAAIVENKSTIDDLRVECGEQTTLKEELIMKNARLEGILTIKDGTTSRLNLTLVEKDILLAKYEATIESLANLAIERDPMILGSVDPDLDDLEYEERSYAEGYEHGRRDQQELDERSSKPGDVAWLP